MCEGAVSAAKGMLEGQELFGLYNIGALIIRIGFPLKGSLKGSIRDLKRGSIMWGLNN